MASRLWCNFCGHWAPRDGERYVLVSADPDPRVEAAARALAGDPTFTYPFVASPGSAWDDLHESDRGDARYIATLVLAAADAVSDASRDNPFSGPSGVGG